MQDDPPSSTRSTGSSRRRFLGLLGAGAAGVALSGRASSAAASPGSAPAATPAGFGVPELLSAPVRPGSPVRPGFATEYVSIDWSGQAGEPRLRLDGAAWNPVSSGCPAGTDAAPAARAALVPGGGATTVEVAGASARAVNTAAGRRRPLRPSGAAPARLGLLHSVRRGGWGADDDWLHLNDDPAQELRDPPLWSPLQVVTVHHTVTANDDPDPAATLRAIYDDHVHNPARDFGDIGYHVLIDADGTVYEGRKGDDASPLFGHRWTGSGWEMVRAAHVALNNTGNFGIALLGDLTLVQPTARARRSLVGVLAVLCLVHDLDPLGVVHYVNSAGERDIDAISLHRQWLATECPGEAFAPAVPGVRLEVAGILSSPTARAALQADLSG